MHGYMAMFQFDIIIFRQNSYFSVLGVASMVLMFSSSSTFKLHHLQLHFVVLSIFIIYQLYQSYMTRAIDIFVL